MSKQPRTSPILALATLGLSLASLAGCQVTTKVEGATQQAVANYESGTLTATLNAPPAAVLAAAEQTLRDRGYSIESNSSTKEQGAIVARPPNYNLLKTTKIAVGPTGEGQSAVAITTNPWDENLARITLDGMMKRLGM
ncbi:MAG: DUF3568 family protein [Phycisphaerales bacterium]|nr:DUF3568 family protein [Planctomycetota bacterium]